MASTIDKIKSDLLEAINASQKKTSPYDTEAEVVRIEGNTAWVRIGGGVPETPVALTINAKKGDKVQVRVSNEGAWIMGNATAPPTDDTKAEEAKQEIINTNIIVKAVKTIAEQAQKIAGNTNQYFWHTESGTDTGAHITEIPQEDFIADPQNGGGNLLARSNGIAVRDGLTELASFSANGIQLGLDTESHLSMDYHSIQAIDKEGETYFYVSDLRDAEGYAELTQIVKTYNEGGYSKVNVMYPFVSPDGYSPTVTIEGVEQEYTYTSARNVLQLTNSVPIGTEATVVYKTTTTDAKAYTLGFRNPDYPIGTLSVAENKNTIANGGYSHAEGLNTTASKIAAHAEGGYTIASGQESHAEGSHTEAKGAASHAQGIGTIASREAQTALGSYNIEDTPAEGTTKGHYSVIVGNGRQGEPSNAFMVDWNGDIYPQATKMTDFIIEQGTSGSWTYRKWNTGVVEAWAKGLSLGSQSSSVWASPVRYKDMTISIPSGIFTSAPTVTMTSATNQWWVVDGNATSATSISSRFATLSSSSQTLTVNIYARGEI